MLFSVTTEKTLYSYKIFCKINPIKQILQKKICNYRKNLTEGESSVKFQIFFC